jgi:hypothetical protein
MVVRKREPGSLTGSQRFKEEKEAQKANSVGAKAKKLAEQAGTVLSKTPEAESNTTTTATTTAPKVADTTQLVQAYGATGYQAGYASGAITHNIDAYGGLAFPKQDFNGLIPSDLLNPQIELQATEEQLTNGLAVYAGATRAQRLLQTGFKYIEEVGKTKQQYHKAEQSIIKGATEGVKVQEEIVRFDKQHIELDIDINKREQSNETLKQEQVKLTGMQKQTSQIVLKIEAQERKRDAEIRSIDAQTQDIIQKYLKDSISSVQ